MAKKYSGLSTTLPIAPPTRGLPNIQTFAAPGRLGGPSEIIPSFAQGQAMAGTGGSSLKDMLALKGREAELAERTRHNKEIEALRNQQIAAAVKDTPEMKLLRASWANSTNILGKFGPESEEYKQQQSYSQALEDKLAPTLGINKEILDIMKSGMFGFGTPEKIGEQTRYKFGETPKIKAPAKETLLLLPADAQKDYDHLKAKNSPALSGFETKYPKTKYKY